MGATALLPYALAVSVMDKYVARQMLEHTGVLLTLVISIHVVACGVRTGRDPPYYSLPVWLGVVLLTLAVPFALPASKGLKTFADRGPAEAAQRRLLVAAWTFPLAVALLAFAHALHLLGQGLEQV